MEIISFFSYLQCDERYEGWSYCQTTSEAAKNYCIMSHDKFVVKPAVKTLPLKIDEFLVDVFYYIHNSTKCASTLQEYADFCDVEFKAIFNKHCETLRLSVTRTLE